MAIVKCCNKQMWLPFHLTGHIVKHLSPKAVSNVWRWIGRKTKKKPNIWLEFNGMRYFFFSKSCTCYPKLLGLVNVKIAHWNGYCPFCLVRENPATWFQMVKNGKVKTKGQWLSFIPLNAIIYMTGYCHIDSTVI